MTKEELNNMTLAEIRDTRVQKMQKLQNMTLAEIEALSRRKCKSAAT